MNEVFDPDRVDQFYNASPPARADALKADRSTNYSVVRLELLEAIYQDLYEQRIQEPDESKWQHRILPSREITKISTSNNDAKNSGRLQLLTLTLKNINPLHSPTSTGKETQTLGLDVILLATGYVRNAHEKLLQPLEHLRPSSLSPQQQGQGQAQAQTQSDEKRKWHVQRDYKLELDANKVSPDAGIWLQGCNESTHGLSDTLLSTLATRGGEVVDSIFGRERCRVLGAG